jgi:NDP-sugar pyrophosphorylase family protein
VARSIGGVYDALMTSRPGSVRAFLVDAEFWDVGTVADYWRTTRAFETRGRGSSSIDITGVRIDPTARVVGSILWNDVDVGAHAVIEECILTDGVRVPPRAAYRRAILIQRADEVVVVPWHDR